MDLSHTSRRDFLKASGALVVSVMIPGTVPIARAQTSGVGDGQPPLLPEKLGAPAEKLAVKEGVVSVIGESQRTTTYGELIGGQHFHHKLEWNKRYGNPLLAKGQATPKKPAEYKIVGRSIPQKIVARKIYGSLQYVTDVKVDGMLHARVIRPPSAGCGPVAIDESSISDIPGARVVREKHIVAVVA